MRSKLVLLTACLAIALFALPAAAQETPVPLPATPAITAPAADTPTADDILARADEVAAAADRAINNVNTMLGFLQVVGLLLTLLLGAAAIVGLRSTASLRTEVKEELAEIKASVDKRLADADTRFEKMIGESQAKLSAFEREAEEELDKIRHYAETATRNVDDTQQQVENAVNALTLVQLGKLQIENRNWNSAMHTMQAAHNSDPTNRAASYYLGELYIIKRDLEQAIDLLKSAQPDGEVFPPAEAALAYALRLQGEKLDDENARNMLYAEAEQRYLRALDIEPGARDIHDASVWTGLGALYRRQNRLEDAYRCYNNAEKVTPYNSYPLINLAMLCLHRGDTAKAREHFRTVVNISERRLETNPMDEWTRYDAITGNLGMDKGEQAQFHLNYILSGKPSRGPMESFLSGLRFMASAPAAPAAISDMLTEVEGRLRAMDGGEAAGA
jgi:tetratricopeptide (TPR) repeat protein